MYQITYMQVDTLVVLVHKVLHRTTMVIKIGYIKGMSGQ